MTDTRAGEWVPQVPLAERIKAVEPDVRDAIVAAERQRPQQAGACCDEPTLVCTTCGDAHVHGDPRPDHERLAGAWHVWLAEKERIEAEAVAAERQRIQDALRTDVEQMVDEHGDRYLHEGDVRRAIDGEVHRA